MAPSPSKQIDFFDWIQYLLPLFTALFYYIASAYWALTTKKEAPRPVSNKVWPRTIAVKVGVLVAYGVNAAVLIAGNFDDRFPTSEPATIFACGSVLVWIVMLLGVDKSLCHIPFRYWAGWVIYVGGETVLTSEFFLTSEFNHWYPIFGITVRLFRLFLLVSLCVVALKNSRQCLSTRENVDAERRPLLPPNQDAEQHDNDEKKDDIDSEWSRIEKTFRFTLKFFWPKGRPRLQMRIIGVVLVIGLQRQLYIVVPRKQGHLIDAMSRGDGSSLEMALYVMLEFFQESIVGQLQRQLWRPLEDAAQQKLLTAVHHHVMDLSMDYHEHKNTQAISYDVKRGHSISSFVRYTLFDLVPNAFDLGFSAISLVSMFGPYLGLITATVIMTFLAVSRYLVAKNLSLREESIECKKKEILQLSESLDNWAHIRSFNRIEDEKASYASVVHRAVISGNILILWSAIGSAVQSLIFTAGSLGACFLVFYQVANGHRPVGDFLILLQYWRRLGHCVQFFVDEISIIGCYMMDVIALMALFEKQPSVQESIGAKPLTIDRGCIKLENVYFSYIKGTPVLKGISFECQRGQVVGCVGRNGSGKTTMLKLLSRGYDLEGGSIEIDGQNIKNVTIESLMSSISIVPHDPPVFDMSVKDNIRYCRPDVTDKEIEKVCQEVGLDRMMDAPGKTLSKGQQQKMALARVLARKSPILLLDEPTSSLDNKAQASFRDIINKFTPGRTTFIVAHRLVTVMHADIILVFDKGEIVQRGTHDDLLKDAKGLYLELWNEEQSSSADAVIKKQKSVPLGSE